MDRKKSTGHPGGRKSQLRQDSPKAQPGGAGKKRSKLQRTATARTNRSNQQCSSQQSVTIGETAQRFEQMQRPTRKARSQLENQPATLENRFNSTMGDRDEPQAASSQEFADADMLEENRAGSEHNRQPDQTTKEKAQRIISELESKLATLKSSGYAQTSIHKPTIRNLEERIQQLKQVGSDEEYEALIQRAEVESDEDEEVEIVIPMSSNTLAEILRLDGVIPSTLSD